MTVDVKKYRNYTNWLQSLPEAEEVGTYRTPGTVCDEPIFNINGKRYLLGDTGDETDQSVIASLPQGNLLKARVFEPFKDK